jgi:hypothetical protein
MASENVQVDANRVLFAKRSMLEKLSSVPVLKTQEDRLAEINRATDSRLRSCIPHCPQLAAAQVPAHSSIFAVCGIIEQPQIGELPIDFDPCRASLVRSPPQPTDPSPSRPRK